MNQQHITYLSLGTNEGNKVENLQNAINQIAKKVAGISKISSIYKTPSWGFSGDDFYNICIEVSTNQSAESLLISLLEIEKELGRKRNDTGVYQNRNIDIDILLYDDAMIVSKDLIVPHSKMLQRKFVLVPLAEIAPNTIHPTAKKNIATCLQNCDDTSEISTIKEQLIRPISISEKYPYIAIEGNIGSGKTSLATLLSKEFNATLILEQFEENPFLPMFYQDIERYAFPLEINFLADRRQQLNDNLTPFNGIKKSVISDYYVFKSLIFAKTTLSKEEYQLYKRVFEMVYKNIAKPDLYIYLHQNTDRLLKNIKIRGRDFEQNIQKDYLQKIEAGYTNFITSNADLNILTIDVSGLDFVYNKADYQQIIETIKRH